MNERNQPVLRLWQGSLILFLFAIGAARLLHPDHPTWALAVLLAPAALLVAVSVVLLLRLRRGP